MSILFVDAFKFCHQEEKISGDVLVTDLKRLSEECADQFGAVSWTLSGEVDQKGYCRMKISVSGTVHLICQRCLTPFDFFSSTQTVLVLARTEDQADEIETWLDDTVDVVVGAQEFNVIQLIEDEFLLALPLSPKHELCMDAPIEGNRIKKQDSSPFSVLKNMQL